MASEPMRDPVTDPLLTPKNSTLIIIDYQPLQVTSIKSMDRDEMIRNIVAVAKIGRAFNLPIVHSTVNVKSGRNRPSIAQLRNVLGDLPTFDRTSINAWKDIEFVQAVKAAGRKKLIMTALWTEACLTFPALDALRAGYEVYAVADAVGGTSVVSACSGLASHRAGRREIDQRDAVDLRIAARLDTHTNIERCLWDPRRAIGSVRSRSRTDDACDLNN